MKFLNENINANDRVANPPCGVETKLRCGLYKNSIVVANPPCGVETVRRGKEAS